MNPAGLKPAEPEAFAGGGAIIPGRRGDMPTCAHGSLLHDRPRARE